MKPGAQANGQLDGPPRRLHGPCEPLPRSAARIPVARRASIRPLGPIWWPSPCMCWTARQRIEPGEAGKPQCFATEFVGLGIM